ncbi:MAG: YkgJ family cysteine cluster protein [Thermodesulfobacteriota bacterium]|nr:YkgJ family cysteine cluster protein [Thermodesulfobacteriota bacterium]
MQSFKRLQVGDTFQFSCHPGIACFNDCCRDLNQFLTPYDILRLKGAKQLSSQRFLAHYTECHIGPRSGLPIVSLRMLQDEDLRCPFVGPEGCTVYEDRPGSCRTYPLGRMAARDPDNCRLEESYFLIREPHCLGFGESKQWTVAEWKKDQALSIYNEMNDLVMEVLSLKNRSRRERLTPSEDDLFAMAFYDLDRFRDFAFEKRLWEASPLQEDAVEALRHDELALLRFAMEWIKGALFGEETWS